MPKTRSRLYIQAGTMREKERGKAKLQYTYVLASKVYGLSLVGGSQLYT
jgi:hypothetical protein